MVLLNTLNTAYNISDDTWLVWDIKEFHQLIAACWYVNPYKGFKILIVVMYMLSPKTCVTKKQLSWHLIQSPYWTIDLTREVGMRSLDPPAVAPEGTRHQPPHPDNTCIKITDHIVIHSSFEISIPLRQNWPKHKSPPPLKVIKKMRQEYYYLKHASKPFVPTSFEISTPSIYWEKSWKKKLSLSSFVGLQCVHKRKWFS